MGKITGKKKTGAQLDREINQALATAPTASSVGSREYEQREAASARHDLEEIRRAPLADRKEAQASFFEAMRKDPKLVAERLGWLFAGNYGKGAQLLAQRIIETPRMNRVAQLTQMIGAFEWRSPEEMTRSAWKRLSASEQLRIDQAVRAAIDAAAAVD